MKQYKRSVRFNRLLQEEISGIIRLRIKDPRIGMATVTRVESTEDLRSSKVYISVLDEAAGEAAVAALEKASGFIRSELLHRIRARRIPALRFVLDRNIAYSVHIAEVIDGLNITEGEEEEP